MASHRQPLGSTSGAAFATPTGWSWLFVAALAAAGLGGCATPAGQPIVERQDPDRFETCRDPDGRAAYERALVELQAGRDAEALPLLRQVVERCPDNVVAMGYYQDAALHLGGASEQAMRDYYAGLDDRRASPVPAFAKARLLETNYQRKVAIDELIGRHADFAYAYLAQGRLNRSRGQLGEAVESFQRAIERHPQLLAAHLELAEVLSELGRNGEARLPYENYLRGAPSDRATAHELVQLLLYKLNQPQDARPWIERLLADDPQDAAAKMDLAAADWRSGRLEAALAGYLDVLQHQPDNARAVLNVGYLHYDAFGQTDDDRRAHWPRARKAFQLFLRLVRPEEGQDFFEKVMAVPYRLKEIDKLLGPGDDQAPTLGDLR